MKRGRGKDHEKPPPPKRANLIPPHVSPSAQDTLDYLEEVKDMLCNQPKVYGNFLDIMKKFIAQKLDVLGVMAHIEELFRGYKSLIQGFNKFLPDGYEIQALEKPAPPQMLVHSFASMNALADTYHPTAVHHSSPYLFHPNLQPPSYASHPYDSSPYGSPSYNSSAYDSSPHDSSPCDSSPYNSSSYNSSSHQQHVMQMYLPSQSHHLPLQLHQPNMNILVKRSQLGSPVHEEKSFSPSLQPSADKSSPPLLSKISGHTSTFVTSGSGPNVASNMETVFYDDIIYSILSFLTVENLSSSMRVSHTFAKNAQLARKNTEFVTVECVTHQEDFVKSILTHCKKIKTLFLTKKTLSKAQIYTVLKKFANTISYVSTELLNSVCVNTPLHGRSDYPVGCDDFFLSFLTRTLPKLKFIEHVGCFHEDDFLYFSQNICTLEGCHFTLAYQQYHDQNMDNFLNGMKTLLLRNPHLYDLGLNHFVGVGEMILKMPKCPPLKILCLLNCNTPPETQKQLAWKFPNATYSYCEDDL